MSFSATGSLAARLLRLAGTVVLAAGLAGCASLFTEPPKHLFQVTPKSTYPANLPHISGQLLIDEPVAPSALDTSRIALSRSPVSLDYFADSEWTDRVPLLVQTALVESFENSRTITAIGRETIGLRADYLLKTEIRHFEAVYTTPDAAPDVWVVLNLRLVKMPERRIIAQTSVSRRQRAAGNDIQDIVLAFDDALGGAMKDAVVWTATDPALSPDGDRSALSPDGDRSILSRPRR